MKEYIALDHDAESLSVVQREFGPFGVKTLQASVLDLPTAVPAPFPAGGKEDGFDLVYAAGLYDYLWQGAAKELTAYSFDLLRSGGRLLIANVLPNLPESGYMEAIMDWWLIYRTVDQLVAVADSIPRAEVASLRTFTDPNSCVAFLEIARG
jgi:extracellular factor (EF) 3-hydroxypalmitic acid methyl ester biosynthesis protein